ncbi:hypothetical protein FOA52_001429 [Chlamydomonas sp. UWO 241]|nr:hypothetical protein FOA52_001429 [Chlamydomonas sp. UWO 241]
MARSALPMLLALSLMLLAPVQAIKLKFRNEECMTYDMVMYHSIYGGYVAMPDMYSATASYHFVVTAPSGTKVHETVNAQDAKFNIVPYESGRYRFCLTQVPDTRLSKYVLIRDVMWDMHYTNVDSHDGVKAQ